MRRRGPVGTTYAATIDDPDILYEIAESLKKRVPGKASGSLSGVWRWGASDQSTSHIYARRVRVEALAQ